MGHKVKYDNIYLRMEIIMEKRKKICILACEGRERKRNGKGRKGRKDLG